MEKAEISKVGVVGAGSWGTALAATIARAGRDVVLWARDENLAKNIQKTRENTKYLAGCKLPQNILATSDPVALKACDVILLVSPAQAQRATLELLGSYINEATPTLICSKGIEQSTGLFMSQVMTQVAPHLVPFVLSGPSFADDVVKGLPTAVTLAGPSVEQAQEIAKAIGYRNFRIYSSDDVLGAQIGGAVKNVLAIACGISDGKGLGDSCRAALITRAFSELMRLGKIMGGKPETLLGLSGFGDLALTASSMKSRNYSLGYQLGQGQTLEQILGARQGVSEGVFTAGIVVDIANREGIEMPICQAVHNIVDGRSTPDHEMHELLARPLKSEIEIRN